MILRRELATGVLVLCLSLRALGQTTTAGVAGTVTDDSGAIVPGVSVVVTNVETTLQRETTSDDSGFYQFPLLPPGSYTIALKKEGFRQVTQTLRLEVNQRAQVDFKLLVGTVSETVEVKAAAPLLEAGTSSVGQVIESKAVSDLPLNGRNFVQLAILSNGAIGAGYGPQGTIGSGTRADDTRGGGELMVNGNREMSNNYLLDGIDNNFRRNSLIVVRPTIESIQEFKMQANLFGAEQGRNSGATVNVITKSGSNAFHGSAFEFLRNDKLDARNFFNAKSTSAKPPFRQNQFGGSLGGPIIRNRIFFFTDYEGLRKAQGTNTVVNTVPTQAMRNGDFRETRPIFDPATVTAAPGTASGYTRQPFPNNIIPANRWDPVAARMIQAYPLPVVSGLSNNQFTNPVLVQDYNYANIRADATLSTDDTIFGRYSLQKAFVQTPTGFGYRNVPGLSIPLNLHNGNGSITPGDANFNNKNAVVALTHVFAPGFLMDVRMGYSRFDMGNLYPQAEALDQSAPGLGQLLGVPNANQVPLSHGVPIFTLTGYSGIGGPSSIPTIRLENTFNPSVNFTKIEGRHTIRFGVNIVRRQIIDFQANQGNGSFSFTRTFTGDPNNAGSTGDAMAAFLLGAYSSLAQDHQLVWAGYRVLEIGSYVADDFRVTNRLTLNLGLRHEYLPPPVEVADRQMNFDIATGKVKIAGFNTDRNVGIQSYGKLFAPRFGFAYQAMRNTVVRGGFGIFYNASGSGGGLYRMHRYLPFAASLGAAVNEFSPNYPQVQAGLPPIPSTDFNTVSNNPVGNFLAVPSNYRPAHALQFNFGVQHQLPWDTVVKATYVGNLGRHLDINYNYNQPVPGPGAIPPRRPLFALAPAAVSVTYAATDGNSSYNALQVSAEKRFSGGMSFLTGYTWSHAIDNVPLQQGGNGEGPIPQDPRYRQLDRGPSSFDIRHRWTQTLLYDLPIGRGKRFQAPQGWMNMIVGNWQVNLIMILQTGLPFTPSLASPVANTGTGSRPNLVGDPTLDHPTLTRWFNTALDTPGAPWTTPALYTFGNSGRGVLRAPGRTNFDISLFKQFPITERIRLQFRAEFFNAFNHPQFDLPNASIGTAVAGTISGTVGTPRDIQFGLRLVF
ncbi:MAG TPA: TonB-dependent receptor [Bryobacteraceae bacterium]|nr:TonB-dependent receptor [Bryobacteraceae bacterium]